MLLGAAAVAPAFPEQGSSWRRMRGIELLRLVRRRHGGRLPVLEVVVCPGHLALRLQVRVALFFDVN